LVEELPGRQWAVRPDGCTAEQAVDAVDLSRIPEPAPPPAREPLVAASPLTVRQREARARKAGEATKAAAAKRRRESERQPPPAAPIVAPRHAGDYGRLGGLASAQRRRERATEAGPPAGKNPDAVALGKLGGKKGGAARAAKLSPEERSRSAAVAARARWAKTTGAAPLDGVRHGTRHAYMNRGCRCALCRQANTDYSRERYQQQRRAAAAAEPPRPPAPLPKPSPEPVERPRAKGCSAPDTSADCPLHGPPPFVVSVTRVRAVYGGPAGDVVGHWHSFRGWFAKVRFEGRRGVRVVAAQGLAELAVEQTPAEVS
jgi:hypothetical protein